MKAAILIRRAMGSGDEDRSDAIHFDRSISSMRFGKDH